MIDSREIGPGDLFVGMPGEHVDGGSFARDGARGGRMGRAGDAGVGGRAVEVDRGAVLAADAAAALGALARAWRRDLAAHVIAVTGSVGKTSTKDLIAALIAPHRAVARTARTSTPRSGCRSRARRAAGTEVIVLEMGMRGFGQIAELAAIAEPDVGVITNIGPVHLEQVGSLEGVAQAKAELLDGMRDGATAVVPPASRSSSR